MGKSKRDIFNELVEGVGEMAEMRLQTEIAEREEELRQLKIELFQVRGERKK